MKDPDTDSLRPQVSFSLFPSTYRNEAVTEEESSSQVKVEAQSRRGGAGREGQEERYSSFSASLPGRRKEEVVNTSFEEDRERRPRRFDNQTVIEEDRHRDDRYRERTDKVEFERDHHRDHDRSYKDTKVDIEFDRHRDHKDHDRRVDIEFDRHRDHHDRRVDVEFDRHRDHHDRRVDIEFDRHRDHDHRYKDTKVDIEVDRHRDTEVFDRERPHHHSRTYDVEVERREGHKDIDVELRDRAPRHTYDVEIDSRHEDREKMGYYDDEGHYHSFRHGLDRAADRVFHPFSSRGEREEVIIERESREHGGPVRYRDGMREQVRFVDRRGPRHTITIPCHHIRIGDIVILQGRPCQVIRITTSAQTGQHRYLGVDLFSKQLREESSFTSNPAPSVIVQNMLGPVFKTYRVLDIRDDGRVVAMTEGGDVRQGLPVIDQDGLWGKLNDAFADGRGSVRVMVINDGGRELAVDYKVIHGSRL